MVLAQRFATMAVSTDVVDTLHLVVTGPASQVLAHELGADWSSARSFRDSLPITEEQRERVAPWSDPELMAPIASGSHPLAGVVVLPCSAGMVGSLSQGISRGLAQRVGDVALKQRWPLVLGIRETPMSSILLANLLTLSRSGVHIVPPLPAFYLKPDPSKAMAYFVDHYCMRVMDLLGITTHHEDLRWRP
jgi:4-hydroxy-3-polyprenylbenzoate decarboxylase